MDEARRETRETTKERRERERESRRDHRVESVVFSIRLATLQNGVVAVVPLRLLAAQPRAGTDFGLYTTSAAWSTSADPSPPPGICESAGANSDSEEEKQDKDDDDHAVGGWPSRRKRTCRRRFGPEGWGGRRKSQRVQQQREPVSHREQIINQHADNMRACTSGVRHAGAADCACSVVVAAGTADRCAGSTGAPQRDRGRAGNHPMRPKRTPWWKRSDREIGRR